MSRYDTYGSGDDRIAEDLDTGFVGINNRLRPDQLKSGFLQKSENGRLDLEGQWQVRKGIKNVLTPFAVSGTALRLPTSAQIGDATTLMLAFGITSAAKDGSDGNNEVDLITGATTEFTVAAFASSGTANNTYTRSSATISVHSNAHGLNNGDVVRITGLSMATGSSTTSNANPNGYHTVSNKSTNSFDLVITNLNTDPSGQMTVTKPLAATNHNITTTDTIKVRSLVPANSVAINGTFPDSSIAGSGITSASGDDIQYDHAANSDPGTITITEGSSFTQSLLGTDTQTSVVNSSSTPTENQNGTTLEITFDRNITTDFALVAGSPITVSGITGGGSASGTGSSNPSDKVNGDHFITSITSTDDSSASTTNNRINITIASLDASVSGTTVVKANTPIMRFSSLDSTTGDANVFLPNVGKGFIADNEVSEVTCGCKFSDPNTTTEDEYLQWAPLTISSSIVSK